MQQQLGLNFTKDKPASQVILFHLTQLQLTWGGISLLSGILRLKRSTLKPINMLDIHLMNLFETYGKAQVLKAYELAYGSAKLNTRKRSA